MKALVPTGLAAGLVICTGSVWLLLRAPTSARKPVTPAPLAAMPVPRASPRIPAEQVSAVPAPPASVSREEQSRRLRLEIERALVSVEENHRERAYSELVPALIRVDPTAMGSLVERFPSGPVREELLRHTAHAWSSIDLQGAIAWAKSVAETDERTTAADEIVSQVGQSDPAHAIEVSDLFGIGRNDGTVEHIATLWATENLNESLRWVESQPPGKQRDQLLARITTVEARTAPAAAANTALKEVSPGTFQDDAVVSVVRNWLLTDATAASEWVKGLPQGRLQELAKAEVDRAALATAQ